MEIADKLFQSTQGVGSESRRRKTMAQPEKALAATTAIRKYKLNCLCTRRRNGKGRKRVASCCLRQAFIFAWNRLKAFSLALWREDFCEWCCDENVAAGLQGVDELYRKFMLWLRCSFDWIWACYTSFLNDKIIARTSNPHQQFHAFIESYVT